MVTFLYLNKIGTYQEEETNMSRDIRTVEIQIKKSDLCAETQFDYKKIEYHNDRFLDCKIQEETENLKITYLVNDYHSMRDIRNYSMQERLRILLDAGMLCSIWMEYMFVMNPDNLFFDENYRVYVMNRDVFPKGEDQKADFFDEYKALAGYALQDKYSYEDYLEGGMDLLKKNELLSAVFHAETLAELTELLEKEYQRISYEIKEKKQLIDKKAYKGCLIYVVVSGILLLAGLVLLINYAFIDKPRLEAKLQAEINFLKGDYIQVIDDLSRLPMEQLSYDQKYILSVSFVNTESLTAEQKNNILEEIPINGDEKMMEYWIYIGRLEPLEAQNIAMQKSNDELLLYAYMMEKDLTETDTRMTGEEKAAKLEELEAKIAKLVEQYTVEEE